MRMNSLRRAGGRCAGSLGGVFSVDECPAHLSHEFVLFGGGGIDQLPALGGKFPGERRDGELKPMAAVFAEGIFLSRFQPFRDHLNIAEGSGPVVCRIGFGGNPGGTLPVVALTENVKRSRAFFCEKFCDDVVH